tara:strand:- start:2401 stop:2874 length:474 start_codon:yes stop_codon:yes gene_type:complete
MKRKKVQKNSEKENKNTTSRLFAVQALFQMEAVGKSFNQIKKELKDKLQKEQFENSTIIKPNYSLCEKIIEGASFNQRVIDKTINKAFDNDWNLKTIDPTLRAILRAASSEIIQNKTPVKVIISQFIEITKSFYPFGKEHSLINGLLNKILIDLKID